MIKKKIKKTIKIILAPYIAFIIFACFLIIVLFVSVQAFFTDYTTDNEYANVDGYIWPLPGYSYISSNYGTRLHPIKHTISFHDGIDIPAPKDTPVLSPCNGMVTDTYFSESLGNTVKIDDGNFVFVFYHLNFYSIQENTEIQKGIQIGGVGTTGTLSTGNHLHFTVYKDGQTINPLSIVNFNNLDRKSVV